MPHILIKHVDFTYLALVHFEIATHWREVFIEDPLERGRGSTAFHCCSQCWEQIVVRLNMEILLYCDILEILVIKICIMTFKILEYHRTLRRL